jgi:hypothetical protein
MMPTMMPTMIVAGVLSLAAIACGGDDSTEGGGATPQVEQSASLVGSWSGSISYERGMFVGESSDAELDVTSHSTSGSLSGSVRVDGETYAMSGTLNNENEVVMEWNEAEFAGELTEPDSVSGAWADLDPDGSGGSFRFVRG